ncbi:hypothetical protein GOP47_0027815 [Adiantum capillus-veneris]|nr:hypothetical protein GOP47_0027815 [Adiantum capillus-veneris]
MSPLMVVFDLGSPSLERSQDMMLGLTYCLYGMKIGCSEHQPTFPMSGFFWLIAWSECMVVQCGPDCKVLGLLPRDSSHAPSCEGQEWVLLADCLERVYDGTTRARLQSTGGWTVAEGFFTCT